jgi:hypothetical protein
MPASTQVVVVGLKDLQRAFRVAEPAMHKELAAGLRRAGEPVRSSSENLAVSQIRRIGLPWSRMRVGVRPGYVYVAPRQRGAARGTSSRARPNLATLLMERSMKPALNANVGQVERIVDEVVGKALDAWARA